MTENTNTENVSAAINANAMLITVSVSKLGVRRRVKSTRATIDGAVVGDEIAEGHVTVNKKLLDCEEYDDIAKLDSAFYNLMMTRVIQSRHRRGTYLLAVRLIDWFEGEWANYVESREGLVDRFAAVYEDRVMEAQFNLGPLFEERDYPRVEQVRQAFAMSRTYEQVGVPDRLAEVNPSLFQAQQKALREQTEKAAQEVRTLLRAGLLQLVDHLKVKLAPSVDGKKKRLHASSIENLREWVALFNDRNVTDDAALAAQVERLQSLLDGVDRETLRDNDKMVASVSGVLGQVSEDVGSLVVEGRRRSFKF